MKNNFTGFYALKRVNQAVIQANSYRGSDLVKHAT